MEPRIKNAIRSRYWNGENLVALAREHGQSPQNLELICQRDGWTIARAMLDDLRSQLAALQA